MNSIDNVFCFLQRGVKEIISEDDFKSLLVTKKDLVIKIGFDPTADKLHLGHYVILKKLREFQMCGYFIHLIIGDFTAAIGDPSGKSSMREVVYHNTIKKNYSYYDDYIFKVLDKHSTLIYFNSVWFNFICLADFIQLISFVTVSQILDRSDFNDRYNSNRPIGLHEFVYPLLQSYDSVFLHADIEIGGIDQKFNLLLARSLQKSYFQKSQVLIMMPILTGLDGCNKMSKSLNNYISLNENYYDMFAQIMSLPDKLLKEYFIYLGFLEASEFIKLSSEYSNPMELKFLLARNIVESLYSKELAVEAEVRFINRVSKKDIWSDLEITNVMIDNVVISLFELFLYIGFVFSHAEFKRLLKAGSIEVNDIIIFDRFYMLCVDVLYFVRCGKRKVKKIFLKKNEKKFN